MGSVESMVSIVASSLRITPTIYYSFPSSFTLSHPFIILQNYFHIHTILRHWD